MQKLRMQGIGRYHTQLPKAIELESKVLNMFVLLMRSKILKQIAHIKLAQGGCARCQLDHGLKFCAIQGGCADRHSQFARSLELTQ